MKHQDQSDDDTPDARLQLRTALALTGYSISDSWVSYFALAGAVDEQDLEAWLLGAIELPRLQVDLMSLAADELLELSGYDLRVSSESY
ncbi:hypothetical protein ACX80U_11580 [Arthrobacter sp. TmT3-37]